jgi:hypothetical protein
MKNYKITLVVDEEWLEVIRKITADVYTDTETCFWTEMKEVQL